MLDGDRARQAAGGACRTRFKEAGPRGSSRRQYGRGGHPGGVITNSWGIEPYDSYATYQLHERYAAAAEKRSSACLRRLRAG